MWLLHILGIDDVSGRWYAFWSGFAGDLALVGGAATLLRKHNCHAPGCWRVGRHIIDGTPWCNKHHQAARAHQLPAKPDPVPIILAQLRDDMHDLTEVTRTALNALRAHSQTPPH